MRLLILLCIFLQLTSAALAQVDEQYGATSHRGQPDGSVRPIESEFRRSGGVWTEYQEGAAGARFVEVRREAGRIYLHDGARGLWLRLDIGAQGRAVAYFAAGGLETVPSRWSPLDRAGARPTLAPSRSPALILDPLNPEIRLDANNTSLECDGRFDHLLEPRTRVCGLRTVNGRFLDEPLWDSHVWLIGDRISTFELAFSVQAYDSLVAKLTDRFGQPQPAARSDTTERTVQWTSGQARLSLTRSPGRSIAIIFATYRPDNSESWSAERVFAGNYWWHGTQTAASFAGCALTVAPGAAFNPSRPEGRLPQGRGPHYRLELRGRRRDSGPGSEFSQAGIFPCEIRATEILSVRALDGTSAQPGQGPATAPVNAQAGSGQSASRPPAVSTTYARQYRISMIIIAPGEDGRQLAQALVTQLRSGASFSELARRLSTDTATADFGGDRGFEAVDRMPHFLATVAVGLRPGEISDPFVGPHGLYIITVTGIR